MYMGTCRTCVGLQWLLIRRFELHAKVCYHNKIGIVSLGSFSPHLSEKRLLDAAASVPLAPI
jgi:hypothetical protein